MLFRSARVVELVDARDSKSRAERRAGSIPAPGTTLKAGKVQCLPAFFFSPLENLKNLIASCVSVRESVPHSGGTWGPLTPFPYPLRGIAHEGHKERSRD